MWSILVGIDDTDNKESRGTGYLCRRLAALMHNSELGEVSNVSRHQHFIHPDIPYTSQNSSACLTVHTGNPAGLAELCRDFVCRESAEGSDAGLSIAAYENISEEIIEFGFRTKREIIEPSEAESLARKHGITLDALTGDGSGIIGALASAGLRRSGNDGRCVWTGGKELRELEGIYPISELISITGIDEFLDIDGEKASKDDRIDVGDWVRPVIRNNRIILLVERATKTNTYEWKVASKEYIRSVSS